MGFRKWVTKNTSKVIETAVEQGKQTLAMKASNKTDLYYKLGRIGLLVLLAWLTGKDTNGYLQDGGQKGLPSPGNVTVNNYIYERGKDE